MSKLERVSRDEMIRRAGGDYLGYSLPQEDTALIREGMPNPLENLVKNHEFAHLQKGEEGPFLSAIAPIAGAVIGGAMASSAAGDAADAAADAQMYAADIQQEMYEQNRQDYMPYLGVGGNALAQLSSLYGLYQPEHFAPGASVAWSPSPGAGGADASASAAAGVPVDNAWNLYLGSIYGTESDNPSYAGYQQWLSQNPQHMTQADAAATAGGDAVAPGAPSFTPTGLAGWEASPEYMIMQDALQVAQDRGGRALDRSAAAGGGVLSGAQAKALADYALGTQAGYMGGAYSDYANRIGSLAGVGQTATQNIASLGQNAASNIGNAAIGAGGAQAAGIMGSANAWGNALNQGLYGVGQAGGWDSLSNLFQGGGNVAPAVPAGPSGYGGYTPGGFMVNF